jgi:exodeoxyribonuclease III
VRLLSWNVNGLRAALKNGFLAWLHQAEPDVVCIQESRVLPQDLDETLRRPNGYHSYWHPAAKNGYSGVATYTRQEPDEVYTLGVDCFDCEGRVQVLEFPAFTLINSYWPNSQPNRKRIDYKLEFCEAIQLFAKRLVGDGKNVIICGDFNIAHQEIDLARPKQNKDSPGFLPEEREAMTRLLSAGFVDTFRHFTPDPHHYTWWSYRAGARKKNVGWRIDYHCVNDALLPRVKRSYILCDVMGSDHCPVALEIE